MLTRQHNSGFSLIELMISIVAGMIVSGALIAFVASTIANNAATVQSVRVSQELRTLAEVVARDLRRARGVADPIAKVGTGCTTSSTCAVPSLTVSSNCAVYSYSDVSGTTTYRSIRRTTSGSVGALALASSTSSAQTCTSTGTQISSNLIDITAFTIAASTTNASQIDITIQGKLANNTSAAVQTYQTTVFVRSGGA